ncbi:MAG: ribosome biogenesis GTPase Der, partial [Anaerolineae bacterium]|nr:ribosome biogenesis GTPase Der [Anaerolineae bacterium]
MPKPLVALIGRPNVGKSTLFNRLIGERLSVVDDQPGTTRDRIYATCEWNGVAFTLVDTGGIEPLEPLRDKSKTALAETSVGFVREIREQAEVAIAEADVVVFVVDAQAGLTATDEAVVEIVRRLLSQRQMRGQRVPPVIVAASKAEAYPTRVASTEFYRLGLGEVYPVSGLHGIGTGDLLDAIVQALGEHAAAGRAEEPESREDSVRVAIVGRPNVGKSSMFNRLIGENRVIVSDIPGTTRDAIDTRIEFTESGDLPSIPITLIDTAGIRKRGSIQRGAEKWSVLRAFKAIDRSDVALLVLDAAQGITAQDEHVAGYILDEDKGAVVLVNKWDKIESA